MEIGKKGPRGVRSGKSEGDGIPGLADDGVF